MVPLDKEDKKSKRDSGQGIFEDMTVSSVINAICDYVSKECPDATKENDISHEKLSGCIVWAVILFVMLAFVASAILGYYSLDAYSLKNKDAAIFQKTPFVFIAVTFAISLIFFDSLIKTLKYKTRVHEGVVSLVIKNLGIFILVWYVLNKS